MLILAAWRIVYLLQTEIGPVDIFLNLRRPFFDRQGKPKGMVGQALSCFYCFSLWPTLPLSTLMSIKRDGFSFRKFITLWLGLSAGAILLEEIRRKIVHE